MKYRLGDICDFEKGVTGIQKSVPGEYPLVVTGRERKTCNTYQFDCEAVCVPLVSSTGHGHKSLNYIHYQTGKFALGTILVALIPKDKNLINAEFLREYLKCYKDEKLISLMKGGANVTLPLKRLQDLEIDIPGIEKQSRIVEEIQKLRNLVYECNNNFDYSLDLLEKLKSSMISMAIQGHLVPQDPNDDPAEKILEKIRAEKEKLAQQGKIRKEKSLPPISPDIIPFEVPNSWVWCRFRSIANIASNLVSPEKYLDSAHVAPNNIEKFTGKLLTYQTVKEDNITSANQLFHHGQILYSKIRPNLSKVIVVNFDGLCSADMYPIDSYINTQYLHIYMLSNTFLKFVTKHDTRVAMPKINQEELNKILIPLPPLKDQYRIVQKINSLMKICDEQKRNIAKAKENIEKLNQAISREMFN